MDEQAETRLKFELGFQLEFVLFLIMPNSFWIILVLVSIHEILKASGASCWTPLSL